MTRQQRVATVTFWDSKTEVGSFQEISFTLLPSKKSKARPNHPQPLNNWPIIRQDFDLYFQTSLGQDGTKYQMRRCRRRRCWCILDKHFYFLDFHISLNKENKELTKKSIVFFRQDMFADCLHTKRVPRGICSNSVWQLSNPSCGEAEKVSILSLNSLKTRLMTTTGPSGRSPLVFGTQRGRWSHQKQAW